MKQCMKFLYHWAPPIFLMGIIFFLSSHTRLTLSGQSQTDFLFFKMGHLIEYAILYFLIFRALFSLKPNQKFQTNLAIKALIIAVLYAFSDEFHQTFVPTREGAFRDVMIDSLGICIMLSYIKYNISVLKKTIWI
ncbi:MAG: VanZ family protein [Candidatus Roizmanbacteria bacterium]